MIFTQSKTLPIVMLILANLVPLFGVFAFGWTVSAILVVYWIESVIIGILNIPRTFAATGSGKLFTSLFFAVHYGLFCAGHAFFLGELFGAGPDFESLKNGEPLLWTALTFFISHLVSLMARISRGEFENKRPSEQLMAPYDRVIIMHISVLFGGFGMMRFGAPIGALVLLIALKTAVDLTAHMRENRKGLTTPQV